MSEDNGIRRYQLILGSLFAAASIIFLLAVDHAGIEAEAVKVYFPYADELMQGRIPVMEYPPFALIFIAVPRLFASTAFGYEIAFVAEAFIFFMIGLAVTGKLAKRYYQSQRAAMLIYTVLMLLMLEFVLDRYDIFPAILTLLSFYCLVTKRYAWAFLLLSIATMTKLYPAVLFPIYLIPFFINRDWTNVLKGTGVFVLTAFLIILPFLLLNSDAALHFLTYHMDRPLQIESTAASVISLFSMSGITDAWIEFGYGSDNLVGPLPDAAAKILTPLILAVLVMIYALYAYVLNRLRKDGQDNENNRMAFLGAAMVLSLLAFIIFGKVFSSQYLIWVIPFVVFMMMTSLDHMHKNRILFLSILAIILTQLNFAVNIGMSGGGAEITNAGMMIVLARNIVAAVLFAYVIWVAKGFLNKRPWSPPPADEGYQKL